MHPESQPLAAAAVQPNSPQLWCADCHSVVDDPLVCRDCSAVICRKCGSPLESADELAFG